MFKEVERSLITLKNLKKKLCLVVKNRWRRTLGCASTVNFGRLKNEAFNWTWKGNGDL